MRILFLAAWYPYPPDNGSKLRVYHLLRALAKQHQVTLLSFAFATAQPDAPGELRNWCQEIQIVPLDPFEVNRAGTLRTFLSPRPVASRPVPAMCQLVTGTLRSQPFAAVIASTGMMIDYALQAPPNTARILEEHNAMTRWAWERYQEAGRAVQRARCWLSWRKGHLYEARTHPQFDLITMVSEADHQATVDVTGTGQPRVAVVPNGVDCIHNQPGLMKARPNRLVYNGSLTYNANYDAMQWFLAQVYPRIRAQVPDVSLAITGSTGAGQASYAATEKPFSSMFSARFLPITPSPTMPYGIEATTAPVDSGMVIWDIPGVSPRDPGTRNPGGENATHEAVRRTDSARDQIDAFARPDGRVEQICDGACDPE